MRPLSAPRILSCFVDFLDELAATDAAMLNCLSLVFDGASSSENVDAQELKQRAAPEKQGNRDECRNPEVLTTPDEPKTDER